MIRCSDEKKNRIQVCPRSLLLILPRLPRLLKLLKLLRNVTKLSLVTVAVWHVWITPISHANPISWISHRIAVTWISHSTTIRGSRVIQARHVIIARHSAHSNLTKLHSPVSRRIKCLRLTGTLWHHASHIKRSFDTHNPLLRPGEANNQVSSLTLYQLLAIETAYGVLCLLHRPKEHHGAALALSPCVSKHSHVLQISEPSKMVSEVVLVHGFVYLSDEKLGLAPA